MTTLPRLGAAALLLASVSTLALFAHDAASAAERAPLQRLAQAGQAGPPPEQKGEAEPQGEQQGEAPDEKGKKKRGKQDGDQGGQQGPPPEQKSERRERGRDRDQNGGGEQRPPREKREPQREEKPFFKKKETPPPVKEQAPPVVKPKELPPPKAQPREPVAAPPPLEPEQKRIETPKAPPGPKEEPKSIEPAPLPKKLEEPPKSDSGRGAEKAPELRPKDFKAPDANSKWKGERDKSAGPKDTGEGPGAPPAKVAPVETPPAPAAKPLPPEIKAVTPRPPPNETETQRVERHRKSFDELKQQRREVKEDGGKRTVIEEPDKRRIIREDGKATIRHDETERFRRLYRDTREERRPDGTNITIAIGPGGIRIMTEVDRDGRALRRWRRGADGRDVVLFDNRSYYRRFGPRPPSFLDAIVNLAPPIVRIPRDRYIVEYDRASDDDIYEALTASPVDDIDHPYSLEEIRQSPYLRDRMRRLDLDTITFDFGSWEVDPRDYGRLERLARVMNRILDRNPDEMFLIEGYTDAVGSEEDNLTLSDRRAETVAFILTEEFGVPAENLITQGYGEQFLKVPTDGPERLNRRTAARRITPLLAR